MMNRTEKKCLIASMTGHVVLLVILLVGSAFAKKPQPAPIMDLVIVPGGKMTDGLSRGGTPPPPAPSQPAQQPQAAPPPVPVAAKPPPPVEKAEDPEPVKPILSNNRDADISVRDAKPSTKHVVKVNIGRPVSLKDKKRAAEQAEKDAMQQALAEAKAGARQLANSVRNMGSGLASTIASGTAKATVIDVGIGGGGQAFMNYRTAVFQAYYAAWHPPEDLIDNEATTEALIVVTRDGTIRSAEIVKRSGKSAQDRSVKAALNRVNKLPSFPEESTDQERSFLIKFNLKSKLSFG